MNTPQSVMNCYRYNLIEIMKKNDIPFPESRIITDKYKIPEELKNCKDGLWIKRGDAHASCKEDVVKVESYKEILKYSKYTDIDIKLNSRKREIVEKRVLVSCLLYDMGYSMEEISKVINKDRTTVYHYIKELRSFIEYKINIISQILKIKES